MNAKEMFEELGYKKYAHKDYWSTGEEYISIEYRKKIYEDEDITFSIVFDTVFENINFLEDNVDIKINELNKDELKAIAKQCEELGWLND